MVGDFAATDVVHRVFKGRLAPSPDLTLSAESQAALRQFSFERITAYGVAHADATELLGRVANGEVWQSVATELAQGCLNPPERRVATEGSRSRANRLYRASALLRMSQMMMGSDTDERRAIVVHAADLYGQAAAIAGACEPVLIESRGGPVCGWLHHPLAGPVLAAAIVIGGVEGWAMDFGALGAALAARGIAALLLDGPGQGETRLRHLHFLSRDWPAAYRAALDHLSVLFPRLPLGIVGNSLGGAVAIRYAASDPRIAACCDNGGPATTGRARANATFFRKMVAHCGSVSDDEAAAIWRTTEPPGEEAPLACPLLVIHGGMDPLIPDSDVEAILARCVAPIKQLVVYSDGDHCVYNHADDKHDLIADWMMHTLPAASPAPAG